MNNHSDLNLPPRKVQPAVRRHRRDVTVLGLLQWAYQDERIDLVCERGGGMLPQELAADGLEVRRVSSGGAHIALGTRIDFGGTVSNAAHPDAELVHDLIKSRAFDVVARGLLIDYAKTGAHPDPMIGAAPKIEPQLNGRGRPVVLYDHNNNPTACLVVTRLSAAQIDFMRGVYSRWRKAALDLQARLWAADVVLTSFNIVPVEIDPAPWISVDKTKKT